MDQEDLLTPIEVAKYLKVPVQTVWWWCREGTLPAFKIGKYWRIPRKELRSALAASGTRKRPEQPPAS